MDLKKPSLPSGSGRSWKCSIMTLTAKMRNFLKNWFFPNFMFFLWKWSIWHPKKIFWIFLSQDFKKISKYFFREKFPKNFFSKIFFFWSFLWKKIRSDYRQNLFWELLNSLPFSHFILNIFIFLGYWVLWHLHCLK